MFKFFRPKQPGKQAESPSEYKDGGISSFQYDKGTKTALLTLFAGSTLTGCFGTPTMSSPSETPHPEATPLPAPVQEFTPGLERVVDPLDIKSVGEAVERLKAQSPDVGSVKSGEGYAQEIRSAHLTDKTGNTYLLVKYDLKLGQTYKGFSSSNGTGSVGVIFVDRENKYMSVKQYMDISAPKQNEKKYIQEFFLTSLPSAASLTAEGAVDIQATSNPGLIKGVEGMEDQGALHQITRRANDVRIIAGYEIKKNMDGFLSGELFQDRDSAGLALASRYLSLGEKSGFAFLGATPPTVSEPGLGQ